MLSEQAMASTFLELTQLRDHARTLGLQAEVVAADEERPLNLVLIRLEDDEQGRERMIHGTYLPVEEQLEATKLLQLFAHYPFDLAPESSADLGWLLARLNSRLPLGSLLVDDDGDVALKMIHPLPRYELLEEEQAAELLQLFHFSFELYAQEIEAVASEGASAFDLLAGLGLE